MRVESSVTAISWIPSEMIEGLARVPFTVGVTHYDTAPPRRLDEPVDVALERLRVVDRFRIANHLVAWAEFDDGVVVEHGQHGGGVHGATTVRVGGSWSVPAIPFDDLRPPAMVGDGWICFRQSVGGHTGVPAPRRVAARPYVQVTAPPAWTTLELTLHADGRCEGALVGASTFPRHWVYDHRGRLLAKSGVVDFDHWYRRESVARCPWRGRDAGVRTVGPGSDLEHGVAELVMHAPKTPVIRTIPAGTKLMEQGDPGRAIALVIDGVAQVVVDDVTVAEIGPGAIIGERASLEAGCRTATLTAITACRLAVVDPGTVGASSLEALSRRHRREEESGADAPVS